MFLFDIFFYLFNINTFFFIQNISMYNCEKEQTSKKKNSNEHEYKKCRRKKKNRDTYLLIIFSLIIGLQDIPLRNNEVLRKITRYRFRLSIYISIVFRRLRKKLSEFFFMSNSHGFQDESPSNDNKTIAISNFLEYNLLISQ